VKLPIDTSAIAFLCALAPEPVVDFETKRPRADENGEPLYVIQLLAMATAQPTCSRSRCPVSHRLPCATAPRSRSQAWSPSHGRWRTAPASRSGRPGSSRPWPPPRPANEGRDATPARETTEGPADRLLRAGPAPPPTKPGAPTPDPCIRNGARDALRSYCPRSRPGRTGRAGLPGVCDWLAHPLLLAPGRRRRRRRAGRALL
jgi:hypothetical protein